jgi:hypothetical protein
MKSDVALCRFFANRSLVVDFGRINPKKERKNNIKEN